MVEYLIYLRKSRQDDPNETIEEVLSKHEKTLQEYALKHIGYRIPEQDIYREVVSGETIADRPMIKEVFSRLEKEKSIIGVLIKDVSRLTRGDLMDMGLVLHSFLYTNTHIITPSKTYDLSNKFDRKLFEMELSRGNDYLEYTKEILISGRVASKKRGNYIHNVPPYGYDRVKVDKDWTLTINEKEAMYVRLIFEMYADGVGHYTIMKKLEELGAKPRKSEHFTEAVIRQMLKNEVYIGKIRIGERSTSKVMENGVIVKKRIRHKDYEVVDGKHEAIVSEELFYKCKKFSGSGTKEKGELELKNMWAGLIKCGKCGKAIERALGSNKRAHRFRCKNNRVCDNKSHRCDEVHNAIVSELKLRLEDFSVKVEENNQEYINSRQTLLNELKKQLEDIKGKQEAICEYLENGVYTVEMFVARNNKLEADKKNIEVAIKNAEDEIPKVKLMQTQLVTFHQTLDMLDDETISAKVKNNFLKKIVDVIYYTKDENGITLDVHLHM